MKKLLILGLLTLTLNCYSQTTIESVGEVGSLVFSIKDSILLEEYIIVKTDSEGNIVEEFSPKGMNDIFFLNKESDYSLYGYTTSIENKILSNPSDYDYWLVKKSDEFIVELFPNPTNKNVTIVIKNLRTPLIFNLLDLSGKIIFNENIINNITNLNVSDLSKGIYLYEILNDFGVVSTGKLSII